MAFLCQFICFAANLLQMTRSEWHRMMRHNANVCPGCSSKSSSSSPLLMYERIRIENAISAAMPLLTRWQASNGKCLCTVAEKILAPCKQGKPKSKRLMCDKIKQI